MKTKELGEYVEFTAPALLHKAINTLRGLVAGITTDKQVSDAEINELLHWCQLHTHLENKHPFSELLPVIEKACEDNIITADESADILWLCNNFVSSADYYDDLTSSVQFLSGMLHGVLADGELSDAEIQSINTWVQANDYLAGTYPYDEIYVLLSDALRDGRIDDDERDSLTAFFSTVIEFKDSLNLSEHKFKDLQASKNVGGICAMCPEVTFEGHTFCFTGEFARGTRSDLLAVTVHLGGAVRSGVSKKIDYLVVGNAGNPCWAYACYGRKIEEAMRLRKDGGKIIIVNETDFWDAVEDIEAGIKDDIIET